MVKFHAPFFPTHQKYQTLICPKNETPEWGSVELYVVNIPNRSFFESQHVILEVVSISDSTSGSGASPSTQKPLGQAIVSMRGITPGPRDIDNVDLQPKKFCEPLLHSGMLVGHISGTLLFAFKGGTRI